MHYSLKSKVSYSLAFASILVGSMLFLGFGQAFAANTCAQNTCLAIATVNTDGAGSAPANNDVKLNDPTGKYHCGLASTDKELDQAVYTSFNIGCTGKGNPITDATFAIIRFLSVGVGLVIVGSLTYAGIQYTASRGDPKATAEAIGRIRSNVIAFLIYIFSFAILNFLIPKGFFGQ